MATVFAQHAHSNLTCNLLSFVKQFFLVSHRVGQRGTGLSATIARSEHEISEIIDGLSEQEVSTTLSAFDLLTSTTHEVHLENQNSNTIKSLKSMLRTEQ